MTSWLPSAVVNHVWQSTIVVAIVWLATLALRRNGARVRYWLWVGASLKFLVPFYALVNLGAQFDWRAARVSTQPAVSFVMDTVFMPVVVSPAGPVSSSPSVPLLPWMLLGVWTAGVVAVLASWWRQWLPVRAALRQALALQLGPQYDTRGLAVWSSPSMFEPAVVGIWRPVLLLPAGLIDRLTPAQVNALLAHERSHVRCHDNLAAAVHMLVEAMFWFHPIVWWIESRLVAERERACDEVVLQSGSRPRDYAEGILEVCRRSVASPLPCITGVGGANLRRRIESIMREEVGRPLTAARRCALACAVVTAIGAPVAGGMLQAQEPAVAPSAPIAVPPAEREQPDTPMFEVASVKPLPASANSSRYRPEPTRFSGSFSVTAAVAFAYGIEQTRIVEAPQWARDLRYEINARTAPRKPGDIQSMMRHLLAERFALKVHRERRPMPVYALGRLRADGGLGPNLQRVERDCSRPASNVSGCSVSWSAGRYRQNGQDWGAFVGSLETRLLIGRPIVDETGLSGQFDITLEWDPDITRLPEGVSNAPALAQLETPPVLFTAVREQLGLKLESGTAAVDVLVIDSVDRPTPD